MLDKWDNRFYDLAAYIADWSKDPSTKVGAVIVDPKNKRIVSTGFNGFPFGVEDTAERLENRDVKYEMKPTHWFSLAPMRRDAHFT